MVVEAEKVLSDLEIGSSIAVNGCCLTAIEIDSQSFAADLSPETLDKTNLGELGVGRKVNLERPLAPTGRLSGHFVQGHVDGTGEFLGIDELGEDNWNLRVRAPEPLLKYLVYKGSIAIDGISLTVARLDGDVIEVAIIPHTYRETNLADRRPGESVNLEADVIAKHVERLMELRSASSPAPSSS
jgi:riboflavin synthase